MKGEHMLHTLSTATFLAALAVGNMLAQAPAATPSGPAAELLASYNRTKANTLKAAEKMPAVGYSYRPHTEQRTFARVVNHISEAQGASCALVNGTAAADMAKVPAETASKDEVVAALKASFVACDKAYASITDANVADKLTSPRGTRSRITVLWGNVGHDMEQYAILSDYLRDKNLVPPTSEK